MKIKVFILLLLLGGGAFWYFKFNPPMAMSSGTNTTPAGRKILYYQSAMHPWIKSDKPGKCPICGMDLVPVYADETGASSTAAASGERKIKSYQSSMKPGETSPTPAKDTMGMDMVPVYEDDAMAMTESNMVVFNADNISVVHVQTETVHPRPIQHTIRVIGSIQKNSATAAWFVFDIYERDLPWIKLDQKLDVTLSAVPDKIYPAQIKLYGVEAFADRNLDEMSDSTKIRARISNPPVEVPGFAGKAYFNNLRAESRIVAATPEVLAVPRSAVISRGAGPMVYVEMSSGHYSPRPLTLGRTGDEYAEVLSGLDDGDKVVINGGLLIDAEAQLSAGR